MARTFNATDYLGADTAAATTVPITICSWFKKGGTLVVDQIMGLADKDSPTDAFIVQARELSGSEILRSLTLDGGLAAAVTTNEYTIGEWSSSCARWKTNSDRDIVLNGDFANKGSESSTTITPSGIDHTSIGRLGDSTPTFSVDIDLAEIALWNVVLTDEELTAFDKGYSPWSIRPASLQHYWRLLPSSASTEPDEVGGLSLTRVSSPAIADHVPIMEPFRRSLSLPGAVEEAVGNPWYAYAQQM